MKTFKVFYYYWKRLEITSNHKLFFLKKTQTSKRKKPNIKKPGLNIVVDMNMLGFSVYEEKRYLFKQRTAKNC